MTIGGHNGSALLIWYVKHRLRDKSVETFRFDSEIKARSICRELRDGGEVAWVENEEGRSLSDLGEPH